jgi:cystathionine beta-lyase/cystathionine gamma-synthase
MLNLTDIRGTVEIAKKNNLISVVDNTFMSPYFQNPLSLGADVVLHSTTKYLNGHCDVVGGILITSDEKIHERLRYLQNAIGSVPSPFDCWLTLRSTKTLALRMKQHNENAMKIAEYLNNQTYAEKVIYPGLKSHPQYQLAKKQMSGFGGMISVDFGTFEKAKKVLNGVKIFALAESLGGVESLICHPASMTHASVPKAERDKMGLTDSLVRFSVGIEDAEDLIADIEQALK